MSDANAGARPKPGLIFEKSKPGRRAGRVPSYGLPVPELPAELKRESPPRLPEVPENEIVRHFTELADRNFGIDTGFYPLGSCTMKHNPRVNERLAALPGFRDLHPHQVEDGAQGALELMNTQWSTSSTRRKWSAWSTISHALRLRRKRIAPVAQKVHVSGHPDCEETQIVDLFAHPFELSA